MISRRTLVAAAIGVHVVLVVWLAARPLPQRSSDREELEAMRGELARLAAAVERLSATRPSGTPDVEPLIRRVLREELVHPEDVAVGDDPREVPSEPSVRDEPALDPAALDEAIALVERAESAGRWTAGDVHAFRARLRSLAPAEQMQARAALVLAINEGRLELPPDVILPY